MADKRWSLDDIPWDRFDPGKLDPDLIKVVKAASMVESNGGDYAVYLCNVFAGDADFQAAARAWAAEEVQHGKALGRWAEMADPGFDFAASFQRFTEGYALHGAYWHDKFGKVRSHGCINLAPPDAAWLFEWTEPHVPMGWHGARNMNHGTLVYIHG